MKKHTKILAVAIAAIMTIGSVAFVSCQKEYSTAQNNQTVLSGTNSKAVSFGKKELAMKLAEMIDADPAVLTELKSAINMVTNYGLDEKVYLYDIANTANSVFIPNGTTFQSLSSVLNTTYLQGLGLTAGDYYGDIVIYWPYLDDWTPGTTPVVCYSPDDLSMSTTTGFVMVNGTIQQTTVNSQAVDNGQQKAIVIAIGEHKYSDYPDFKNGVWAKGGARWANPWMNNNNLLPWDVNVDGTDTIYEARAFRFTSSGTHYDYFWNGGSEFSIVTVYVTKNGAVHRDRQYFELSRKQINELKYRDIDLTIHEDWQPQCGNVDFMLYEVDDTHIATSVIPIHLEYQGCTLNDTIMIHSSDDTIGSKSLNRSNYLHRCAVENGIYYLGAEKINCLAHIYSTPTI